MGGGLLPRGNQLFDSLGKSESRHPGGRAVTVAPLGLGVFGDVVGFRGLTRRANGLSALRAYDELTRDVKTGSLAGERIRGRFPKPFLPETGHNRP